MTVRYSSPQRVFSVSSLPEGLRNPPGFRTSAWSVEDHHGYVAGLRQHLTDALGIDPDTDTVREVSTMAGVPLVESYYRARFNDSPNRPGADQQVITPELIGISD